MISEVYNMDCMDFMQTFPDKFFEIAIVDPPYGIGAGCNKFINGTSKTIKNYYKKNDWDLERPSNEYFEELFRVSKNQMIWGGNYFTEYLYPVKAWIFWYKGQRDLTMSDGEMAWTSFPTVTRQIEINRWELKNQNTFHPTEKPYNLYRWILSNYAKQQDKILDTHLGSGSIAIACHDLGFDLTACELDTEYYNSAMNRLRLHQQQQKLEL